MWPLSCLYSIALWADGLRSNSFKMRVLSGYVDQHIWTQLFVINWSWMIWLQNCLLLISFFFLYVSLMNNCDHTYSNFPFDIPHSSHRASLVKKMDIVIGHLSALTVHSVFIKWLMINWFLWLLSPMIFCELYLCFGKIYAW